MQVLRNQQGQLATVTAKLRSAEFRISGDSLRMRHAELQQHLAHWTSRKEAAEMNSATKRQNRAVSIPEQRELLLVQVKEDNADIQQTEGEVRAVQTAIESCTVRLRELDEDILEKKRNQGEAAEGAEVASSPSTEAQKYQLLMSKDKEMTEFIEAAPESKKDSKYHR
eukprot:GHVS01040492.1.p1 GENE.GHVS01040492.1~~GHVS01040492.1.p1  ORF type:complete len:168 (-),score=26.78 GHVS01040492.1:550-1053(-)